MSVQKLVRLRLTAFMAEPRTASFVHRLGSVPILGYMLKLGFAAVRLPILERNLEAVEQSLGVLLENSSKHLSALHSMRAAPESLHDIRGENERLKADMARLAAVIERLEASVSRLEHQVHPCVENDNLELENAAGPQWLDADRRKDAGFEHRTLERKRGS